MGRPFDQDEWEPDEDGCLWLVLGAVALVVLIAVLR
jgi:hypothetical protein